MDMRISRKTMLIGSVLIFFIAFSFLLRALPALQMDFPAYHLHGDPDTWYNYRQVEVMVSDFPRYNWFDPMTAFPSGKYIAWGPAFPFIAASLSIMVGATQRFDIMLAASWVPILFALFMIPVMFYLGRLAGDWKTGLISSVFIAVVSGNYYYESYFGVLDHHIAEVFFTTVFGLFYISALQRAGTANISLILPASWKILLLPSVLAGVAFGVGMLTSPTCILFLGIVGVYTVLQYSWNLFHGKSTDYLFIINCIIGVIPLLFLVLNGIPSSTYSLLDYSVAQIHIIVLFILGTAFIQILSLFFKKNPFFFILSIIVTFLAVMGILFLVSSPTLYSLWVTTGQLFNPGDQWATVKELKPWSLGEVWVSFNIGIILALAGLILIVYQFLKNEYPEGLYISVWAIWILLLTTLQIRWEYYCAVVISLLSAYALGCLLILDSVSSDQKKEKTAKYSKTEKKREEKGSKTAKAKVEFLKRRKGTLLVLACLIIFCSVSVLYDCAIVRNTPDSLLIPQQWVGTLEWIQTGTPDPNIPYLGPYEYEHWQYPDESYGILSWWDSGHWITYIAKRIPVTNPFQDNIKSSAEFFLTESEDRADDIADSLGVRYVMTDSQMVFGKFPGMIQWYDKSLATGYYSGTYYLNDEKTPENSGLIGLINQPYYSTMIVRLHNFDGSMALPNQVALGVLSGSQDRGTYPVINSIEFLDNSVAQEKLKEPESLSPSGTSAVLGGFLVDSPIEKVGALHHYRLVYEDAAREPDGDYEEGSSVKVFEYVQGARLIGEGTIEVKIRTNLGRTFVYRQEATDGVFILPYPTEGGTYPVTAIGPYTLVSSGRTVDVREDDVKFGNNIS